MSGIFPAAFFGISVVFCAVSPLALGEEIVFSARVMGPVSNIYSVSVEADFQRNTLKKITENIRWRDVDADISVSGDVVFSSNREANERIDLGRRSERFDLYLIQGSGAPMALTHTPKNEMQPRFSPDGKSVAFLRSRNQLVLLEIGSRQERVLYEAQEIQGFDWSPDGTGLAVAARDPQYGKILQLRCNADCVTGTLEVRELKRFPRLRQRISARASAETSDFGSADHLRWSPDGKFLAFIFHPDNDAPRSLSLLVPESGAVVPVSDKTQQVQSPLSWSRDGRSLLYAALVDYRFFYDETAQKKVYQGAMQVFRRDLNGQLLNLTQDAVAARAPIFIGADRIAYLQADRLAAREYALVLQDLAGGGKKLVFDGVSPDSHLAVRR